MHLLCFLLSLAGALRHAPTSLRIPLTLKLAKSESDLLLNTGSNNTATNQFSRSSQMMILAALALAVTACACAFLRKKRSGVARAQPATITSVLVLNKRLGEGGFGQVRLGVHHGVRVALKTATRSSSPSELQREAALHASLSHPNILTVHGATELDSSYCLVLELAECSLWDALHDAYGTRLRSGPPDAGISRRCALEVAEGLAYLHARQVTHCDVTSRNVLLVSNGHRVATCKLADFGLARDAQSSREKVSSAKLSSASGYGSPQWMAPELHYELNNPQRDWTKIDSYGFGMVLFELISGFAPWHELAGGGADAVASAATSGRRPQVPDDAIATQPSMLAIMRDCWQTDPTMRPSIDHARGAISQIIDSAAGELTDDQTASDSNARVTTPSSRSKNSTPSLGDSDDSADIPVSPRYSDYSIVQYSIV